MKKAWAILITSLINVERTKNNLLPVSYNWQLDTYLREYPVADSWYYADTDRFINWTIEGQNRYCRIEGCHFRPMNYSYLFRETYKDSIPKIIRMRLSQRDCNHTDFVDGMPCSWKYIYYDTLMQDFTNFACKSLNFEGRWVPEWLKGIQKKSFMCYFDSKVFYWK